MENDMTLMTSGLTPGTTLACALTVMVTAAAHAQEREKCFGMAAAAQKDCAAGVGIACAGASRAGHRDNPWKLVPADTCLTKELPAAGDGAARVGALGALSRDIPA